MSFYRSGEGDSNLAPRLIHRIDTVGRYAVGMTSHVSRVALLIVVAFTIGMGIGAVSRLAFGFELHAVGSI